MTVNSIEYISAKHFRSPVGIAESLVAVAAAVLPAVKVLFFGFDMFTAAFAAFSVISALFVLIRMFAAGVGCSLLRLSLGVMMLLGFLGAIACFAAGLLVLRRPEIETELVMGASPGLLANAGPRALGLCVIAFSALFYLSSCCAFMGIRYLGAVRSCIHGTLKRGGLRLFPIVSVLLFVFGIIMAVITALLSDSGRLSDRLQSGGGVLLLATVAAYYLHLLLAALSAASFARKTFAYKVFEKQIMRVETNADGTVYVPINEDADSDDGEKPAARPVSASDDSNGGKGFIREFAPAILTDEELEAFRRSEAAVI